MKIALIILAILAFVLATFNVAIHPSVALIPLGLALFAASFLPWKS